MKCIEIQIAQIESDPSQPRLDVSSAEIDKLAADMSSRGLLQPVIVFAQTESKSAKNPYCLVDGARRMDAARQLKWKSIFAIELAEKPDADALLLIQLAANCMRIDLKPMEKAFAYQRLLESKGWNNTQLAENLNVEKSTVTRILSFLKLPEKGQQLLDQGIIGESTAYSISRAESDEVANKLLALAENGSLSRDEAASLVKRKQSNSRNTRLNFMLGEATIQVATTEPTTLTQVVQSLKRLIKECQKANRDSIDAKTLEKILADQNKKEV